MIQRIRVPLGFLFGAAFVIAAAPSAVFLAVGIGIAFFGLLLRAWSAGHIRKNTELAASGPYARTRNPLYLGSFIMGLGFMVASAVWWLPVAFTGLFLGIYLPVMRIEARELTQIFGDDYKAYAEAVPLFFPSVRAYSGSGAGFDGSLYMKYREYQAALGFVLVSAVLILKAILIK